MKAEFINDQTIWAALKNGDKNALSNLYFRNYPALHEYGMRLYADESLLEDCIHDLFLKIWTRRMHLNPVANVQAYLFTALRNGIYSRIRQNAQRSSREMNVQDHFLMVFSVESEYIRKENHVVQAKQVAAAIQRLSPRQRELIYLKYFEELSYEEIADIMQVKVKAIYKLSARAHETLRSLLKVSGTALVLMLADLKLNF